MMAAFEMADLDGTAPFQARHGTHLRNSRTKHANHKRAMRSNTCAVFVHAGAGYHSFHNELLHIEVVRDACKVGMSALEAGSTAVDAVELAIKLMEDAEITNAGFGSNLAMDGVVECDACIVDQYGRSGAVGAIAQVQNPIQVARKVLNHSYTSLLLKRVPPILLVGQGATDFAASEGVAILPYDTMVAESALLRWSGWQKDLEKAARRQSKEYTNPNGDIILSSSCETGQLPTHPVKRRRTEDPTKKEIRINRERDSHLARLLSLTNQESQSSPSSPVPTSPISESHDHTDVAPPGQTTQHPPSPSYIDPHDPPGYTTYTKFRAAFEASQADIPYTRAQPLTRTVNAPVAGDESVAARAVSPFPSFPSLSPTPEPNGHQDTAHRIPSPTEASTASTPSMIEEHGHTPTFVSNGNVESTYDGPTLPEAPILNPSTIPLAPTNGDTSSANSVDWAYAKNSKDPAHPEEDHIIDTVGVVAIDSYGNIACGASSGGISMKFRGRVGPAALLGVSCAVRPVDHDDPDHTCVATVTSGTGEHMATSMAATMSADRMYHGMRKVKGGRLVPADETEILSNFIKKEFMGHPGVATGTSPGTIGIVGVKKTDTDIEFSYAHNTDSFVLGFITSFDSEPECTMSRTRGNGVIACSGKRFKSHIIRRV